MSLSKKIIDAFKQQANQPNIQIDKKANAALRADAMQFATKVGIAARKISSEKRASFRVSEILNGALHVLRKEKPTFDINTFFSAVYDATVVVPESYTETTLPDSNGLFSVNDKNQKTIKYLSTLRINELMKAIHKTRNASREAVSFLARAVDVYVTFVLSEAVYRAQLEKKKRITVSHLGLSNDVVPVPVVDGDGDDDTAELDDKDGDDDNAVVPEPVVKKATRVRKIKVEGEAKAVPPTIVAETKPIETKPIETKPIETKPIETKPAETKPIEPAKKKGRKAADKVVAEVAESEAASVVAPLPVFSQVSCDGGSCSVVSTIIDEHQPIKPAVKRKRVASVDSTGHSDVEAPAAKKRAVKAK
jgi:histone H3/H4